MSLSVNRKVGRPSAAQLRSRGDGRELITTTALRAFAEYGYHGVSIRDIARAGGVSMSAMYHYFPSKQDLLYALLQNGVDNYHAIWRAALDRAGDDPLSRLDALVAATIEYRVHHKVESNLMLGESRNLDADLQEQLRMSQEDATQQLANIIAQGLRDGVFSTPFPEDARRAVQAMCNAIARWYEPDGTISLTELVARYQHLARSLVGGPSLANVPPSRKAARGGSRRQVGPAVRSSGDEGQRGMPAG